MQLSPASGCLQKYPLNPLKVPPEPCTHLRAPGCLHKEQRGCGQGTEAEELGLVLLLPCSSDAHRTHTLNRAHSGQTTYK